MGFLVGKRQEWSRRGRSRIFESDRLYGLGRYIFIAGLVEVIGVSHASG
ncbi:MAG: hypothetical protein KME06_02970 [Kastovskya adunca ATA6-11-RM4]|nr:hypothetical protein [Kastovskya adunca ATA6-11-RM4]